MTALSLAPEPLIKIVEDKTHIACFLLHMPKRSTNLRQKCDRIKDAEKNFP